MFIRSIVSLIVAAAPMDVAAESDGSALYAEHCATCHGADLEGQPNWRVPNPDGTLPAPPHDDSGHTWHHPDDMLRDYTRMGGQETLRQMGVTGFTSAMPGFGDVLDDTQIESILSFIKSRWSLRSREHQRKITEASQ